MANIVSRFCGAIAGAITGAVSDAVMGAGYGGLIGLSRGISGILLGPLGLGIGLIGGGIRGFFWGIGVGLRDGFVAGVTFPKRLYQSYVEDWQEWENGIIRDKVKHGISEVNLLSDRELSTFERGFDKASDAEFTAKLNRYKQYIAAVCPQTGNTVAQHRAPVTIKIDVAEEIYSQQGLVQLLPKKGQFKINGQLIQSKHIISWGLPSWVTSFVEKVRGYLTKGNNLNLVTPRAVSPTPSTRVNDSKKDSQPSNIVAPGAINWVPGMFSTLVISPPANASPDTAAPIPNVIIGSASPPPAVPNAAPRNRLSGSF